jgi:DNA (cytosine-5)-methyltransferase 1
MMQLVLSLFPGIGMLDMAFEEAGFCVVRGPDLLWGGDIKRFHPPSGRFDGVIGGPPCQAFSSLRHIVIANGGKLAENLIPEYERCIAESSPEWFLMEEVPDAPEPSVPGYKVHAQLIRDVWCGGETNRLRRFSFGTCDGRKLQIEMLALHRPDPEPTVLASGGHYGPPIKIGGSGKVKRSSDSIGNGKRRTVGYFKNGLRGQGLPSDFLDHAPFTIAGKISCIGNGVPLAMGRAVAAAILRTIQK